MPGVTADEIVRARQMDLLTYLKAYNPGELVKSTAREYRTVSHNSLVISNGRWDWKGHGIGGRSALDYLVKVENKPFVDAVRLLNGNPIPIADLPQQSKPKTFHLPPRKTFPGNAVAYLQKRGIDSEVIQKCLHNKTLYQSHDDCVFVGYDKDGKPRNAFVRGIQNDSKKDVFGSDKRYGFALNGGNSDVLFVFEGTIDAMSRATLDKMNGLPWEDRHYVSLGGTTPLALSQYLTDHPQIQNVYLCLDNDRAGVTGMIGIQAALRKNVAFSNIKIFADPPPATYGKDYNKCLLARRALLRKEANQAERGCQR